MAEIKGAAADRFVERPDPKHPIILIHGPDRGRVSMRARALLQAVAGPNADPMASVELDAALLDAEPARLAEEADSVSMFGDHKTIFVRMDEPKALVKPVEQLLAAPPIGATLVIAAGDLKKSHPLRSRIEKAPAGASLACYAADRRDIASLLMQRLDDHKLTITPDAQRDVLALLGADHALSAGEIDKLCLFALKDGQITSDHVDAILVDGATHTLGDVSDAAYAGRRDAALNALGHALSDGMEASVITQNLLRHGQALERMKLDMNKGQSADSVIARARPPIFFKRRGAVETALQRWSSTNLRACLSYLDEELVATRLSQTLKRTRLERQVLRIATQASRAHR